MVATTARKFRKRPSLIGVGEKLCVVLQTEDLDLCRWDNSHESAIVGVGSWYAIGERKREHAGADQEDHP